ncbi:hypothetical protein SCP_1502220 [Sparassis crispa]|uniref:NADP-dependent oxidoreductase domain-containing protein n=1 Tax=Sparassis crispa TaxID=139825 RepID=A0A401H471_9APHY|nr:hypothetical protein SCP_1502220 [Sparassis crispa]GBE89214.1 hypothetical protein SCP_1502220 [Sparassis crispa]
MLESKVKESDKVIIPHVEKLAKKKGVVMVQIGLAWIQMKVTHPIVGCSSVSRLEDVIVKGVDLTPEETAHLEVPYVHVDVSLPDLTLITRADTPLPSPTGPREYQP